MSKNTKKKVPDLTDEQVIEMIAEEVFQNAVNGQNSIADPFEVYAYHAQAKIFADANFFKERCLRGYQSLLKSFQ
ncbi:MAG: hypothetical protein H0T62_01560 [Parachlamydiaceae bacterium]|nr:hypothetical protein [Parachlamydiaceae bacterium]